MRPDQDLVALNKELLALVHSIGDDGELTKDTLARITTLEGEYPDRVEGVVKVINALKGRAAALKAQADMFRRAASRNEIAVENLREHLLNSLRQMGVDGVKGPNFAVRVKESPPSIVVDLASLETLPEEYVIVERRADKRKLLQYWKDNGVLFDGVEVFQGEHLDVRVV
jgi:hypothetical protein